ncbi:U2 small nuclear ribonucleoprotein A'-like [Chenopodium quinoa]|uniref:U2 small nuclear ribonucleoprotein A'-like n=1 Tax=Chenopodium quinoa TaxID=63459 RepID=UPI000B77B7A9|nr:U2 small nuclear ribonucleoprotein A'-like [Chenopodium quinoa]XP_021755554.1 U2 small nuclear ribonucleoprotein A'-like [Chenopodium quinoa]
MVKLNADLIWKSPHFFNAIKERELDLRGNKIAYIENLGATEDQFDTIDLSDNEIVKLENFPYLNRLGTLLLNNNRITRINPNIGEYLPKLHTLVLTNNRLVNLVEIDPLASISKLKFLSLLDNNITKKPNYRLYVIYKLKSLRVLDFKKVKQKEREEADKLFSSKEAEEEAKKVVKTITSEESPIVEEVSKEEQAPKAPTPEQIIAIKAAIVNSQTLEEVARLEKALKSGQLPADLKIFDTEINNNAATQDDKMVTDGQNETIVPSEDAGLVNKTDEHTAMDQD